MRPRSFGGLLAFVALLLAAGTAAGDPGTDKQRIDSRIDQLRGKVADASTREGVLTSELSGITGRLRAAQAAVSVEQERLRRLEAALAAAQERLAAQAQVVSGRVAFLHFARRLEATAQARAASRLREIYLHGNLDAIAVVLGASSVTELIDRADYARRVAHQDRRIADEARQTRRAAAAASVAAERARRRLAAATAELAARTAEERATRQRLVTNRDAVAAARSDKALALASAREDKQAFLEEVESLEADSAALAAKIRASQSGPASPSGSGQLQWPVSGPVTSGFGIRWGRMHEGIDIAVPTGTPVHTAAAGRVLYAGWLGGYGNLVVIDHGGGISTAYGHNSSLVVSVGQDVTVGDVIAYSGSTGHSTGPHLHFEVRVNGVAVDPLGYL
jgi:murein DD-endopeptidase MepM/ murein hydrolase activator NlpD